MYVLAMLFAAPVHAATPQCVPGWVFGVVVAVADGFHSLPRVPDLRQPNHQRALQVGQPAIQQQQQQF